MAAMHVHTTSLDLDEAQALLRDSYPTLRFHRRPGDEPFVMEQRLDGVADFNVVEMSFSLGSTSAVEDSNGYVVLRTSGDPMHVSNGRRAAATERPALIMPGSEFATTWGRTRAQGVLVPVSAFREHLDRRVRSEDLAASDHVVSAPSPALAAQWNRFQDYLVRDFFRADGAFDNELIRATTQDLCVQMMMSLFFPPDAHRPADGRGAMPAGVKRAMTFIDEHAREPISIADIADAARLSIRGLQAAMRRHLDVTPYEYVRTVRLNGVHAELRHPVSETTVASTANAWGFAHLGRFAGEYRELFGETPRATLQRSRA